MNNLYSYPKKSEKGQKKTLNCAEKKIMIATESNEMENRKQF
jgi:hypothetical protein